MLSLCCRIHRRKGNALEGGLCHKPKGIVAILKISLWMVRKVHLLSDEKRVVAAGGSTDLSTRLQQSLGMCQYRAWQQARMHREGLKINRVQSNVRSYLHNFCQSCSSELDLARIRYTNLSSEWFVSNM